MQVGHYFFSVAGVKKEDLDNCLNWAFGNLLHEDLDASVLQALWNQRHSDIFEVTDKEAQIVDMFLTGVGRAFVEAHYNVPKSERRIIK